VAIGPEGRRARARIAITTRHHPDRPVLVEDDRRRLKADALEQHIRELVDTDPPLTLQQRDWLAALLLSGGDAA